MDETPEKVLPAPTSGTARAREAKIDETWTRVFLTVFCCLAALIATLFAYFFFQRPEALLSPRLEEALLGTDHASVALCLYYIKALQYNVRLLIVLRFLGMFVGALCILLGALFVLKGIETNYQFNLHSDRASSSLTTTSPGLVLITLGVVLVALTQFRDQELISGTLPSCEPLYSAPARRPVGEPPPSITTSTDGGVRDLAPIPLSEPMPSSGGTVAPDAGTASTPVAVDPPASRNPAKRRHKSLHLGVSPPGET